MARKKPQNKLSVKVKEGIVLAVSEEIYPFMETDGYHTKVTREMQWDKDRLISEIADIQEQLVVKEKEVIDKGKEINVMTEDLKEIQKLRQWKQVKDNWKVYSKVYGGIVKENKLIQETQKRDQIQAKIKYESDLLENYKEVLEKMENDRK